jgi:hypothetical protein
MSKTDDPAGRNFPDPNLPDPKRRGFLKSLGFASAAAAAPTAAVLNASPAEALAARPDQRAQRYRESDHIRKYYETNSR